MNGWLIRIMVGRGPALFAATVAMACGQEPWVPLVADPTARWDRAIPRCEVPASFSLDTIARGLEAPWDMAFRSDGSVLVTERPGRVRVISAEGVLQPQAWLTVAPAGSPGYEVGLMGISAAKGDTVFLAATFPRGQSAPAKAWRRVAARWGPEHGLPNENRVLRVLDGGPTASGLTTLVDGLGAGGLHAGGALRVGPDGRLYTTLGDGGLPWLAGSERTAQGSVLRFESSGGASATNPWPRSAAIATGLRNVQGLAWLSDGTLLAVEHGPTGMPAESGRSGHDELNVIVPGADYGWPVRIGLEPGPSRQPIAVWTPAIAPGGIAAPQAGLWAGNVLITGLRGAVLVRLELSRSDSGWAVGCEERLLERTHGRLRAVHAAPDGSIWLTTSNRDGRGVAGPADDLVLRLTPRVGRGAGAP